MADYTIRRANLETDVPAAQKIVNASIGRQMGIQYGVKEVTQILTNQDEREKERLMRQFVIEKDDQIIGIMGYGQSGSRDKRRRFYVTCPLILDDYATPTLFEELFAYLLEQLNAHQPEELKMTLHDFQQAQRPILEKHGFTLGHQNHFSELILADFDGAQFTDSLQRVTEAGIELVTLPRYRATNSKYRDTVYELTNKIIPDIPGYETYQQSMDEFEDRFLFSPLTIPDVWMLALHEGELVGTSFATKFGNAESDTCVTQLTGVLREHRRKGITLAMKLKQIEGLKALGFRRIVTGNEENNPMYQINVRLGFARSFGSYDFHKIISPE